jgi:hypothetical protein
VSKSKASLIKDRAAASHFVRDNAHARSRKENRMDLGLGSKAAELLPLPIDLKSTFTHVLGETDEASD